MAEHVDGRHFSGIVGIYLTYKMANENLHIDWSRFSNCFRSRGVPMRKIRSGIHENYRPVYHPPISYFMDVRDPRLPDYFIIIDMMEKLDDFIVANAPSVVIFQYYLAYSPEIIKLMIPVQCFSLLCLSWDGFHRKANWPL